MDLGSDITLQLVGDQNPWRIAQALEMLAEESLGRLLIAPALHGDIQGVAVLVNCAPEAMVCALDRQHDLIKMPFVAPSWLTPTQFIGILLAETQRPLADCLEGHDYTPACHQLFDVAKAQRKPEVEPCHMADDFPGLEEAAVKLGTCHPGILERRGWQQQLVSTARAIFIIGFTSV